MSIEKRWHINIVSSRESRLFGCMSNFHNICTKELHTKAPICFVSVVKSRHPPPETIGVEMTLRDKEPFFFPKDHAPLLLLNGIWVMI
jgi:hypothetical protein